MPMLNCYVTEDDMRELLMESQRSGRKVEELAEAAISNAICEARRVERRHMKPPPEYPFINGPSGARLPR